MCPDRDLVSAYVDGEVPSPWRERLEEHLASCANCSAIVSGYSGLGARLRAYEVGDEASALTRGRAWLDTLLEGLPAPKGALGALPEASAPRSRRRTLSLPLPLAAAAAILVILLGGATTLLALRPRAGADIRAVASSEILPMSVGASAQPASMEELLRFLDARDGQVTLTINLPSGTTFGSSGKPVIMRSAQAVRGTPVGGRSP